MALLNATQPKGERKSIVVSFDQLKLEGIGSINNLF